MIDVSGVTPGVAVIEGRTSCSGGGSGSERVGYQVAVEAIMIGLYLEEFGT